MSRFTVLHVCMGNICRSPMAERLFVLAMRKRLGDTFERYYVSHGAGTGSWHVGQPMNAPAARELRLRGADPEAFRARRVTEAMIDESDLVLCATAEQVEYVLELRPDAVERTFVLGEFGRLLDEVDQQALPAADSPDQARERGTALVRAVAAARTDPRRGRRSSRPADDLDDPYGLSDREFARIADQIEATVVPLADALVGAGGREGEGR
jgi:protein-tyrosine phosphatase